MHRRTGTTFSEGGVWGLRLLARIFCSADSVAKLAERRGGGGVGHGIMSHTKNKSTCSIVVYT